MDLSPSELLTKASLYIPEYGSRSEDDERRSTCPLIPSPNLDFSHPLAQLPNTPSDVDKGGLSPSSVGTEISSVPPELPLPDEDVKDDRELSEEKRSSSSSSSSCVLPETASAQLLHSHNRYLSLAPEIKCQENGGVKHSFGALTLCKASREYAFMSWNWPMIRKWCFWTVMSATIACICVIIGYISTIPTKCDPKHKWYQGAMIYQIFPASFQDSNNDGVGDIRGIAARAPYLQKIGAKAVRISYIFPANPYPEHYYSVTNLTAIEPTLGTIKDFKNLIKTLHDKNISLILDLPVYPYFEELKVQEQLKDEEDISLKHVILNNHILASPANSTRKYHNLREGRGIIGDIIKFWSDVGVDGFYLEGLEELAEDPRMGSQLVQWRNELRDNQILCCSYEVLERINQSFVDAALQTFSLVEFRLNSFDTQSLISTVKSVVSGVLYSKKGNPWPFWTLGSLDGPRLSSRVGTSNMTLAITALSSLLPGSNGLLYGDEIGLYNVHDIHHRDSLHSELERQSVGPMLWSKGGRSFTQAQVLPWHPHSAATLPGLQVQSVLKELSKLRDNAPSLYMSYICGGGMIHPNTVLRDLGDGVISVERSYPRRHTFLIVANLGKQTVNKDLSSLHYGGRALLDHSGPIDLYTSFKRLTLYPAEFVLVKLDR